MQKSGTPFHSTHWFSAWILLICNFWLKGCGVASTFYSKPWRDPKAIRQHLLVQQHVGLYLLRCFWIFSQVNFSGWIQVDNTDTKTKRAQTMLQCPNNFLAMNTLKLQSSTQIFPTLPNHDWLGQQWKFYIPPPAFQESFFFWLIPIWLRLGYIDWIPSLYKPSRSPPWRPRSVSGGNGRSGLAPSRREGMGCQERWYMCFDCLKKSVFFFQSEYFLFFGSVFFCYLCLFGCVFFGLKDAYLKKGGSLVLVCQVDGVPGVHWISSTVAGAHCQIREENQRGKTRASWFLQKRGWKFVGRLFLAEFF